MPKPRRNAKTKEFDFLMDEAKKVGSLEARIITPSKVVVEERVVLKCQLGCHMYGQKFVCPPMTPSPGQFRKILKEYDHILVAKFPAKAEAEEDVGRSLLKNLCSADVAPDLRDRTRKFWDVWNRDKRNILLSMLDLEKAAFNKGYALAIALTAGSCTLCEKCNIDGTCTHPTMARFSEHALGVNVRKTLRNIGMSVKFPFEKKPEGIGMLLIE
jgi:predicted metal-binding protein